MNQVKSKLKWLTLFICTYIMVSCTTSSKVIYLQNEQIGKQHNLAPTKPIVVQPQDQISIVVSCRDPKLTTLFNLTYVSQVAGSQQENGLGNYGQVSGYTVDSDGNINFPVLGKVSVSGLSREEITKKITSELERQSLAKEPIVTVQFLSLQFSVLGEVNKPGRYNITKDRITLLEAISMAGDLSIFGKRDKVYLTRQNNDSRITYQLDLRDTSIYSSPAFYLKQDDVIYVEPNKMRSNQSTINGNNVRSVSLWMSIASFLTTIGVLIFK